jgi:hypothetical protein
MYAADSIFHPMQTLSKGKILRRLQRTGPALTSAIQTHVFKSNVFQVATLISPVWIYRRFGETFRMHLLNCWWTSGLHRKVSTFLPDYTAQHPIKLYSSSLFHHCIFLFQSTKGCLLTPHSIPFSTYFSCCSSWLFVRSVGGWLSALGVHLI